MWVSKALPPKCPKRWLGWRAAEHSDRHRREAHPSMTFARVLAAGGAEHPAQLNSGRGGGAAFGSEEMRRAVAEMHYANCPHLYCGAVVAPRTFK